MDASSVYSAAAPHHPAARTLDRAVVVVTLALTAVVVVFLLIILGVTSASLHWLHSHGGGGGGGHKDAGSSVDQPLGLPGIETLTWNDIVARAYGQTVQFWASTVSNYDEWIDQFLAVEVARLYGVTVVRVPISDAGAIEATQQIAAEKAAGNNNNGSVGLVWTNGPDFLQERTQQLLYGPWAQQVPNAANFDFSSPGVALDFGQPTDGYELPYNAAQIIFIYNPQCISAAALPQSMPALAAWVTANPGKFTYASPGGADGDYTGSAFIRHFLYEAAGGYRALQGGYSAATYKKYAPAAFALLRSMDSAIYRQPGSGGGAAYYPPDQGTVDNLFAQGKICITLSYDPDHVGQLIYTPQEPGALSWPNTTQAWLPQSGTIGNVNFVAISYNAGSLCGALVVADYIASMAAQYKRRSIVPPGIGTIQAYSPGCDAVQLGGWSVPLADLPSYPQTPSDAALAAAFLPEVDPEYALQMQTDWTLCVQQQLSTASTSAGGSGVSCT